MRAPLRVLLVLLLAAVAAGCSSIPGFEPPPEPQWLEYELEKAPPRRDLLTECQWALRNAGYPPGERDEALGEARSGWDVNLHPMRFRGMRYMGVVAVETDTPGKALLRVRVIVERNTEERETTVRSKAKWEAIDDDVERAEVLLIHVLSQLRVPMEDRPKF